MSVFFWGGTPCEREAREQRRATASLWSASFAALCAASMIAPSPVSGAGVRGRGESYTNTSGSIPGVGSLWLRSQRWWEPSSETAQICNSLPSSRVFCLILVSLYVYGIIEAILGIYEGLGFGSCHNTLDIFGNGVNRDGDFLFSETEHRIEGSGGFDFICGVAFRVTDDGEHGGNDFSFEVFGVDRGSFLHAVDNFFPLLGSGHTGRGGFSRFMGALIDLFVSVGEVAFMFILVTPDGVVTLGMFGEGFDFALGEFFHFTGDVHHEDDSM